MGEARLKKPARVVLVFVLGYFVLAWVRSVSYPKSEKWVVLDMRAYAVSMRTEKESREMELCDVRKRWEQKRSPTRGAQNRHVRYAKEHVTCCVLDFASGVVQVIMCASDRTGNGGSFWGDSYRVVCGRMRTARKMDYPRSV